MATFNTEIRKLQPIDMYALSNILNQSDSWKKLMSIVPVNDGEDSMFNSEHFIMIEQAIRQQQRSGAEIFLSEWSTLSKQRPTCKTLLNLLIKAQLFRAADYLAVDILKGDAPERPKCGPAATIDVSEKVLKSLLKNQEDNLENKFQNILNDDSYTLGPNNFINKATDMIPESNRRTENAEILSDLIKFNNNKSDLTKFCIQEKISDEISDLIKLQIDTVNTVGNMQADNYVLQEAQSTDIPLCVQNNTFHLNTSDSSIDNSEITESVDSTNVTGMKMLKEQMKIPNISYDVIPLVVLEYNEKDKT